MHSLLEKLSTRKGPLSDRAFARKLAIPPGLYNDTMAGRRQISDALLAGIAGNFRDMDPDICNYLRERFHQRKSRVPSPESQVHTPARDFGLGTRDASGAS
jgi:hypothetical protein